jgi:molecular chaperone DnaJ
MGLPVDHEAATSAPGDLYVIVHVKPHEFFERDGDHVVCKIDVSMVDACLGAEIEVPTLDGSKNLKVPKGVNSGEVLRFRGQGFPNLRGFGRGDQLMVIQVVTPINLTRRQEELLREFAEIEHEQSKKSWTRRFGDKVKEALA